MNKNLIIDRVDGVKSVTVGISFVHGSRNETSSTRGFSHFLEHMLFKGTNQRTAYDISNSIEKLGGFINGFTTHDYVLIYAKVPYYAINEVVDILVDIAENSIFDGLESEKNVVLEEIGSIEDDPEEKIYEDYMKNIWVGTTLQNPIAGSVSSIESIIKDKIIDFYEEVKKRGCVFVVSGNVSELKIPQRLEKILEKSPCELLSSENIITKNCDIEFDFHSKLQHSLLGFPMAQVSEQDLYSLSAINSVLLDGMSSRLFQLIREKYGLVYDIYPVIDVFGSMADYGIYFSSNPDNSQRVYGLVLSEINSICKNGFNEKELEFSKSYMKGNMLLGLENTNSRMFMKLKDYLYKKEIIEIDDKLRVIDSLKLADINDFMVKNICLENLNRVVLKKA